MTTKPPDIEKQLAGMVKKRWTALRLFATVFGLLSALALALGVVYGFYIMVTPAVDLEHVDGAWVVNELPPDIGRGLSILFGGLLASLALAAVAQYTRLQLASEHQQRVTNLLLYRLMRRGKEDM